MKTNLDDLRSDIEKCMKNQIKDNIRKENSNIKDVNEIHIYNLTKSTTSKDSYSFDAKAELIEENLPSVFCEIKGTVEISLDAEVKVSGKMFCDRQKF